MANIFGLSRRMVGTLFAELIGERRENNIMPSLQIRKNKKIKNRQ